MNHFLVRIIDVFLAGFGLLLLSPILLLVFIACYFDTGSPVFCQQRIGRDKKLFELYKFRSMLLGTQDQATHLTSEQSITRWGRVLRRSKLDELPQLLNVFVGDMSLVGPRPGLENQLELLSERDRRGVFSVVPGITGLSQVRGLDMSTPRLLARSDALMIKQYSVCFYCLLIMNTIFGRFTTRR